MGAVKRHFHDEILYGQTMPDEEFEIIMDEAARDERAAQVRRVFRSAGSLRELNELAALVLVAMSERQREVS